MQYFTTLAYFLLFALSASGQVQWAVWSEKYKPAEELHIRTEQFFNGVTLVSATDNKLTGTLIAGGRAYVIAPDVHITHRNQSRLIYLPVRTKECMLLLSGVSDSIDIYFQYTADITAGPVSVRNDEPCSLPPVLPQSVWRAGLPDPVYGRAPNHARHCIIHHADSPNWDSNYVALTRAFYLQHTQINGWSDIGYNYLIGWDGTLIAGRDPDSSGLGQDEVLGAHFCGKNSGTMGICMIGSYMEMPPSPLALRTLTRLLSWKMHKDHLQPQDSMVHAGELLPVIGGHRDGCATLCPGDSLYVLIPAIRDSVEQQLALCPTTAISNPVVTALSIYPDPVTDNYFYLPPEAFPDDEIIILSPTGNAVSYTRELNRIELNNNQPAGIYICILRKADKFHIIKFIKI